MDPASTSTASRDDAVLVIVDIQERLAAAMDRRDAVMEAVGRLIRTAALTGVPIIVTRQYPKGLGDVEPAVRSAVEAVSGTVPTVWADKLSFDCFGEPTYAEAVAALGRRQLVIAGMETHICVTQTGLSARRAGLDVHVVADACCSRQNEAHALALERMRAAGATVTCAESVLYELVGVAGSDEFRELLRIVKE